MTTALSTTSRAGLPRVGHTLVLLEALPSHILHGGVGTPFGELHVARCGTGFLRAEFSPLVEFDSNLRETFPGCKVTRDDSVAADFFENSLEGRLPMPLAVTGSPFRLGVWHALLGIPRGRTVTYAELAARTGRPAAIRATASAVAANTIALAIPCHRVIRSDGTVGEFRWGAHLKAGLLAAEARG